MKPIPDPENEDALLAAILQDEDWRATDADLKSGALAAFRAHHRARRLTQVTGCVAALAAVIVLGAHWFGGPSAIPRQLVAGPAAPAPAARPAAESVHYLTDAELIATFPPGSCFIAEVDGQKKLIFNDHDLEREFVAGSGR